MRKQTFLGVLILALGACACGGGADQVEDDTKPGGVCEIHNIPFAVEVIPIHYYGKPGPDNGIRSRTKAQQKWIEEWDVARWESFRYTRVAHKVEGCLHRPANFAKVNYCPECVKAEKAWIAKHPWSMP